MFVIFNFIKQIQYVCLFLHVSEIAQARPVLQTSLMQRMTDVLSRMLNDPATRAALCGGGEDSLEGVIDHQDNTQNSNENVTESNEERRDNEVERMERTQIQSNQGINYILIIFYLKFSDFYYIFEMIINNLLLF